MLGSGQHVILDIDVQGARQFQQAFPQSVTIFVLPPSGEVLLDRLRNRKTESPQQLAARLHSALQELRAVEEYEYIVVNDDLEQAVQRYRKIIDAEVVSRERVSGLRESGRDADRTEKSVWNTRSNTASFRNELSLMRVFTPGEVAQSRSEQVPRGAGCREVRARPQRISARPIVVA